MYYILYFEHRLLNMKHSQYFGNKLIRTCGRTVESGRYLPEFWFRMVVDGTILYFVYYKIKMFAGVVVNWLFFWDIVMIGFCILVSTTMEEQYTAACYTLTDEFTMVNRRVKAIAKNSVVEVQQLSSIHCQLVHLVRLFNDEYGISIFLTTLNLLFWQVFMMNDVVAITIDSDKYSLSYINFSYIYDTYTWIAYWYRLWWVCYRMDGLIEQVCIENISISLELQ